MALPRRTWLATLADPAILSDLRHAAAACMRESCNCDPGLCEHPDNRMTPMEFCDWLDLEMKMREQEPVRFEPGHRPRRMKHEQLNLSIA